MMIKTLHINLNRFRLAHYLLDKIVETRGLGICPTSEPNKAIPRSKTTGWETDGKIYPVI